MPTKKGSSPFPNAGRKRPANSEAHQSHPLTRIVPPARGDTECDTGDPNTCPRHLKTGLWSSVAGAGALLLIVIGALNESASYYANLKTYPILFPLLLIVTFGSLGAAVIGHLTRRHLWPYIPAPKAVRDVTREAKLLHEKLGDEHGDDVLTSIAGIVNMWAQPIGGDTTSATLAKDFLRTYVKALGSVLHPTTGVPLYLSNFEVYALCVKTMLDTLKNLQNGNRSTVRVTTVLRRELHCWFNIGVTRRGERMVAFTTGPWEDYKNDVAAIMTTPGFLAHAVQMRRIVELKSREAAAHQYIFCDNDGNPMLLTPHKLRWFLAPRAAAWVPKCMELLKEVVNASETQHFGHNLYAIAEHNPESCCNDHGNWQELLYTFEEMYHNNTHRRGKYVHPETKGVYYTYVAMGERFEYEDVFLVDLTEAGGGKFGVGFYRDDTTERPGIALLSGPELEELFEEVEEFWDEGGEQ